MDIEELICSQNDVSLTLAKHIFSTAAEGSNSVFSPLSLHVVLGLIAAGSSGPTQADILSFLKSNSVSNLYLLAAQVVAGVIADGSASGGPRLSFANGVWVDQSLSLKPSFKEIVDIIYKAASQQVDFQNQADKVCKEVNAWAENQTNGLIKDILPSGSIDSDSRLVFANALYFKGNWDEKFDASETKEHDFHLLDGSKIKGPFMTSSEKQFVRAYEGFKVLRLLYEQGGDRNRLFSMYLYLPDAKDGLPDLVEKLASGHEFLERHIPAVKVELDSFLIPKFKISFGFEASKALKELGLVLPFSGEGLNEVADSQNLAVSSIFHKAFVEVNEEGTEAAAAAAASMVEMFCLMDDVSFVADHPFLFVIREDLSGVVKFIGSVANPTLA